VLMFVCVGTGVWVCASSLFVLVPVRHGQKTRSSAEGTLVPSQESSGEEVDEGGLGG